MPGSAELINNPYSAAYELSHNERQDARAAMPAYYSDYLEHYLEVQIGLARAEYVASYEEGVVAIEQPTFFEYLLISIAGMPANSLEPHEDFESGPSTPFLSALLGQQTPLSPGDSIQLPGTPPGSPVGSPL